jgi:hypothetical protein
MRKEISKLSDQINKNLRPLPHVWDVNKMVISKNGFIKQSSIRSGEADIEAEVISGGSKPSYGSIMDCPSQELNTAFDGTVISDEGEMFLEKYVRTISKEGVEQVMQVKEFQTMISSLIIGPTRTGSLDPNSKISDHFGNAEVLNGQISGTIGVKFGVRLIYVPPKSFIVDSRLEPSTERVGLIGNNLHIPLVSFEHDVLDKSLQEIDKVDENMGEDLKCYVDGLVMQDDYKLIFGTLIKTKTFTSLFAIYSFHNFFESIGFKEVDEDRIDNINKRWKREVFENTKNVVKKQFRQIYRLDDDDLKEDNRREKRQNDADFLKNLLPDAYLGLDGSIRWWQKLRIVDLKPFDLNGESCTNDFQKLFKD